MSGASSRRALLLGCTTFADPTLAPLRSPRRDVEELAGVLSRSGTCGYTVSAELDCTSRTAQRAIEGFLARARTTDGINVLYLSCHGIQDARGRLHFAFADTEKEYLSSTAVAGDWVTERLDASRSKSTLMLIDCCFSGAFIEGMRPRSSGAVNVESLVSGVSQGRRLAVLTASGETEISLEDADSTEVRPSYFTEALIAGLSSGAADLNRDGRVTVDELYEYVYDRIVSGPSPQRPRKLGMGEGTLVVADAPTRAYAPVAPPLPPPDPAPAEQPPPLSRQSEVLRLQGVMGYASFDGRWVVVGKDGVGQAHKSERRFDVGRLVGVAGRPATRLHHGFFQVLLEGVGPAPVSRFGAHAGLPPMDDVASISYPYKANANAERLSAAVQAAIDVAKGIKPTIEAPAATFVSSAASSDRSATPTHSAASRSAARTTVPHDPVAHEPRAEANAGERDGAEAMTSLPMIAVDGLVSCQFDVVRWLGPWRAQWASGQQPAPWLPALARSLGGYAAPDGCTNGDFWPSPAYLAGYCEGMRRTWYGEVRSGLVPADHPAFMRWIAQPRDPRLPGVPAATTIADLRKARGRANRRTVIRWVSRPLMWLFIVFLAITETIAIVETVRGGLKDENGVPFPTATAIGLHVCFVAPLAVLVTLTILDLLRLFREHRRPQ
ncbi:caspase family protein [Actinoplanes sp. NPDC051346]|uniref:caspase family protein n=1 Tax=Actinoplanes sp. NPDC051346 TaxID=3155048 RepID=UPI00341CA6D2